MCGLLHPHVPLLVLADGLRHLLESQAIQLLDWQGREKAEAAVNFDGDLLDHLSLLFFRAFNAIWILRTPMGHDGLDLATQGKTLWRCRKR